MGDNLYWMITITDRNQSQKFLSFYKTYGIEVVLSTLGKGTAASEILNDFGLEATQKAVLLSVVTGKVCSPFCTALQSLPVKTESSTAFCVASITKSFRI